jgi:hypothetical protein
MQPQPTQFQASRCRVAKQDHTGAVLIEVSDKDLVASLVLSREAAIRLAEVIMRATRAH